MQMPQDAPHDRGVPDQSHQRQPPQTVFYNVPVSLLLHDIVTIHISFSS
jgi:hypothetical protein